MKNIFMQCLMRIVKEENFYQYASLKRFSNCQHNWVQEKYTLWYYMCLPDCVLDANMPVNIYYNIVKLYRNTVNKYIIDYVLCIFNMFVNDEHLYDAFKTRLLIYVKTNNRFIVVDINAILDKVFNQTNSPYSKEELKLKRDLIIDYIIHKPIGLHELNL